MYTNVCYNHLSSVIMNCDNAHLPADVMPSYWMFPYRPAWNVCKVVVHEPVESKGRTEEELAEAVREAIISGLPEEQRPLSSS